MTQRSFHPWVVLVIVCLAQFMVILDATIVNVALPSIQTSLKLSETGLQWIVNSYTLIFGGFLLLGGRAGDLIGRRRLFLAGVVVFTVASLVDGLAANSGMLIVARGLQGLGGALVSPVALSIVTTTFKEGKEREKALGVWAAIAVSGSAFGLLLGGVLTETISWRWIFFVNVPIGIATFLLTTRFVPESKVEGGSRHFDALGAVAVTGGLVALVFAIVKAPSVGWASAQTLGIGALAVILLGAFVFVELRSRAPLVRLSIFRVRTVFVANTVLFLVVTGMFAMFFFVTIFLQNVLHFSPIQSGLSFLPFTAGIMISATLASQFATRIGIRGVVAVALLVAASGMLLLTRVSPHSAYARDVLPALLLVSLGMGFVFVCLTLLATSGLANEDQGLASGLFNTSQQVGGALGLAILSTIAASRTTHAIGALGHKASGGEKASALVDGFHVAFAAGAGFMAAASLLIVILLRRHHLARVEIAPAAVPLG